MNEVLEIEERGLRFMIHPSYTELIEAINANSDEGAEEAVLNSRYSLVLATSKRARQLIAGDKPMVPGANGKKPLSIAIEELYKGKVKILPQDENSEGEASYTTASYPSSVPANHSYLGDDEDDPYEEDSYMKDSYEEDAYEKDEYEKEDYDSQSYDRSSAYDDGAYEEEGFGDSAFEGKSADTQNPADGGAEADEQGQEEPAEADDLP